MRAMRAMRERNNAPVEPVMDWIEQLLPLAVHFAMPNGVMLFDDEWRGLDVGLRLPFPVIALEYMTNRDGGGAYQNESVNAPKRIALAVDLKQSKSRPIAPVVLDSWRRHIPDFDDGIVLFSLCEAFGQWIPMIGALWFNTDEIIDGRNVQFTPADLAERSKFYDDNGSRLRLARRFYSNRRTLLVNPAAYLAIVQRLGERDAQNMCAADLADEITALMEFMEAASCSNVVSTIAAQAPKSLNRKRERKQRCPLFEYRVLSLELPQAGNRTDDATGKRSDRASPRVHLRRGHIRRLEVRKIWVNAAVVGAKDRGLIVHDYSITKRERTTQ